MITIALVLVAYYPPTHMTASSTVVLYDNQKSTIGPRLLMRDKITYHNRTRSPSHVKDPMQASLEPISSISDIFSRRVMSCCIEASLCG